MTEEQIKQNAEAYANTRKYTLDELNNSILTIDEIIKLAFIEGAHSRDEEVEGLEDKLAKQAVLLEERGLIKFANLNAQLETENLCMKNQIEELSEQLKMNAENIQKLRNPWISVEERLPDKSGDYLVHVEERWIVTFFSAGYGSFIHIPQTMKITHWMPIPDVK